MHETHGAYKVSLSPYPGLRAFRKDESDVFFGRDDHVDLLIKKLANAHFVCVTGPSGCGKSSLVRTGLQNGLEAGFLPGRGSDWIFCDFNPGDQPLEAMTRTVARACARYLPPVIDAGAAASSEDEVGSMVAHGIKDARHSNDLARILAPLDLGNRPILLFVDQFEELFRYAQREPNAAVRFVEILLQTAAAKSSIYVVITIRTDELEKCSRYTGLTRFINESQFLTPTLDRYQIQEAIEGPIAIFGGKIDAKLTIWLLNSLDEELDKLPLMQHALKLLYAHKSGSEGRPDVRLTIEDFVTVFGLDAKLDFSQSESRFALRATLERRLEVIYDGLPRHLRRAAARMFCALTAADSGSRDIRRPLPFSVLARAIGETEADTRAIVEAFRSGDENYLIVKGNEDGTVDVPHECILRLWPRLQNRWLANERRSADNIWLLARQARDWDESETLGGFVNRVLQPTLLKSFTLDRFHGWFEKYRPNKEWAGRYLSDFAWPVGPPEAAQTLATDAIYGKVEELFAASNRFRRRSRWMGALAAASCLTGALYIGNMQLQSNESQRQAAYMAITQKVSESRAGPYPVPNLRLAAVALREAQKLGNATFINLAVGNLWEALAKVNELSRATHGGEAKADVFSTQLMPGSEAIVTLDRGGQLRSWPYAGRRIGAPAMLDKSRIDENQGRSLAVSPLGDVAAAGYNDGSIRIFDLGAASAESHELLADGRTAHDSFVFSLTFSRDGTQLFSVSDDGKVRSWSRGKPGGKLFGAATVSDWTTRVIADTRLLGPVRPDGSHPMAPPVRIWSLDVTGEMSMAAFGLGDGRVCIVKLALNAAPSCSALGHGKDRAVKTVRFQPGRATLVSAGNDDHIAFWRLTEAALAPTATRIYEDSDIWDLDFSDDGKLLASASWDGSVRLYDPDERRLLATMSAGDTLSTIDTAADNAEQQLRTVRFDRSARLLATSSFDGTARVLTPFENRLALSDLSYRYPFISGDGPKKDIAAVALGGDGQWLAFHDRSRVFIKDAAHDLPVVLNLPAKVASQVAIGDWVSHLAIHPSQRLIAVSAVKPGLVIWARQASGKWEARPVALPGKRSRPRPLAVSADGGLLAVAVNQPKYAAVLLCPMDAAAGTWTCDATLARRIRRITIAPRPGGRGPARPASLAFSASGRFLAVGNGNGTARVFDIGPDNPREMVFTGHTDAVNTVAFAPDERSFLTSSVDRSLRHWSLTGSGFQRLKGHLSFIAGAAFSANGKWIASASQDESVIIWNAADGKPVAKLPIERDSILSFNVRRTPRGTLMATGSAGGNVSVMRLFETPEEVLGHAEQFLKEGIGLAPEVH